MGIFKKPVEKPTTAKSKHLHVKVSDEEFNKQLKQLAELKETEKQTKAKIESLEGIVKDKSKEEFLKLFIEKGVNPNTFIVESDDAQVMVLPMDKYLKVDSERYEELKKMFGKPVKNKEGEVVDYECEYVEEKVTYTFNNELLEKHFSKIEKALEGIKGIPQEDKDNLISSSATYSVKSGVIDQFKKIADETDFQNDVHGVRNDVSVKTKFGVLMNYFAPIFSLKSYLVKK
jgi:hypothetical protein